jgi:hypothetical protein
MYTVKPKYYETLIFTLKRELNNIDQTIFPMKVEDVKEDLRQVYAQLNKTL